MNNWTVSYIGLGSNMGSREQYLNQALELMGDCDGIDVLRTSDFIQSSALADMDQPDYINAVVQIRTSLTPENLLECLLNIEDSLGRVRTHKWGPRVIDLDLLLYGEHIIHTDTLTVPHEHMHLRSFVLTPLAQLAGDLIHPVMGVSIAELQQRLSKCSFALHEDQVQLVSIAGNIGIGKTTLARQLIENMGGSLIAEPYDSNPFMPEVYEGRNEYALDSQLHFLVNRAKQLDKGMLSSGQLYFSDYLFDKELVYANLLLDKRQLCLYQSIYQRFAENVALPVLLIYLDDSAENCLERIHLRNRSYEQDIQRRFLDGLRISYNTLINNWSISPVIKLDTREFDCLNINDINTLVRQIEEYVHIPLTMT